MNVGAVIPPHRLYSARAPIHPKRPIWLDPSGCPPGRVFSFQHPFSSGPKRFPAKWIPVRVKKTRQIKNLESRSDFIGTEALLAANRLRLRRGEGKQGRCFACSRSGKPPHDARNAAMLLHGLTVARENNPSSRRVSWATKRPVMSRTGQRTSFPQNILVTSK
jgi:hypothetical protein